VNQVVLELFMGLEPRQGASALLLEAADRLGVGLIIVLADVIVRRPLCEWETCQS